MACTAARARTHLCQSSPQLYANARILRRAELHLPPPVLSLSSPCCAFWRNVVPVVLPCQSSHPDKIHVVEAGLLTPCSRNVLAHPAKYARSEPKQCSSVRAGINVTSTGRRVRAQSQCPLGTHSRTDRLLFSDCSTVAARGTRQDTFHDFDFGFLCMLPRVSAVCAVPLTYLEDCAECFELLVLDGLVRLAHYDDMMCT